jgi:Ser/Thr protein kinase RdoA (MazF antagonist)
MEWTTVEQSLETMQPVEGGFSRAHRGIVTLPDGVTVFVKMAADTQTSKWIEVEKSAYHWLERAGYRHAPRLLTEGSDGFALADLSRCDWGHTWDDAKVSAMLKALDDLAALSTEDSGFMQNEFPKNLWHSLPNESTEYRAFLDIPTLQQVERLLNNESQRKSYATLAGDDPWRGQQLVHYDARADNFAYDRASGMGYLVDWDWIGLGNAAFDRTGLLVNVQLAGFDVLDKYGDRLDKASLAWLMGFWLKEALGVRDTDSLKQLRTRQAINALAAHKLLQRMS